MCSIYTDGGVARLRVYGNAAPDWSKVSEKEVIYIYTYICA
jgi:allantoicase